MLDRTLAPEYHIIDKIDILRIQTQDLAHGVKLHTLNAGELPIIKLEVILPAGNYFEAKENASFFTVKMLPEGTKKYTSNQITEYVDQFGAFSDFNNGSDKVSISFYTLEKYLEEILIILCDLILEPTFPEKELNNLKQITLQNLQVNLEKNSFLASRILKEVLFGKNHPYGRSLYEQNIMDVQREDLVAHWQNYMLNKSFDIILAGQLNDSHIALTQKYLGNLIENVSDKHQGQLVDATPDKQKKHLVDKSESLQSSIRIGKHLFQKNHPDYFKMTILNEIFGGYFGSRLMKNLREDKGLTYGVYASLAMHRNNGYMTIGTDVKKELTEQTLNEIYKEALRLQQEPIEAKELETVQNYMLGSFAGSINTAFDLTDIFKSIYFSDLDYSFYDQYLHTIRTITPDEILETAQKYLSPDSMFEVVVGGK
jgi:zinc protease